MEAVLADLKGKIDKIVEKSTTSDRHNVKVPRCNEKLCSDARDRLVAVFEEVKTQDDEVKQRAVDILLLPADEFIRQLREQNYYRFGLYHLSRSHRLVETVYKLHRSITSVYIELGLEPDKTDDELNELLMAGRFEQRRCLEKDARDQVNFLPKDNPLKRKEALVFMRQQLQTRFDGTVSNQEEATSVTDTVVMEPEMKELMQSTLDRQAREADVNQDMDYDWYIPKACIKFGEKIGSGTFGIMHKATLTSERTGKTREVAIKILDAYVLQDDEKDVKFFREFETWLKLRNHPNVLTLLGACHVAKPKFLIMEYATEGNLHQFFRNENTNNRKQLWKLLGQAAEGLKSVHDGEVPSEHGGLKTKNLLLSKDKSGELVVKISDFGVSVVRVESVSLSARSNAKDDNGIWRAPERLKSSTESTDFRKADIYCLGLCVIDAATGEEPFAGLGPKQIVGQKIDDCRVPRPKHGFSDEEWKFVDSMCDPNPARRPNLDEVIARMAELNQIRQATWTVGFAA